MRPGLINTAAEIETLVLAVLFQVDGNEHNINYFTCPMSTRVLHQPGGHVVENWKTETRAPGRTGLTS